MSKITIAFLFTTIAMIASFSLLGVSYLSGTSGMLFVVALIYCYLVDKRDFDRQSDQAKDGMAGHA